MGVQFRLSNVIAVANSDHGECLQRRCSPSKLINNLRQWQLHLYCKWCNMVRADGWNNIGFAMPFVWPACNDRTSVPQHKCCCSSCSCCSVVVAVVVVLFLGEPGQHRCRLIQWVAREEEQVLSNVEVLPRRRVDSDSVFEDAAVGIVLSHQR